MTNKKIHMIAHRGLWNTPEEKNTEIAFKRAIESGYGIETDFRDHEGALVIAHDTPLANAYPADSFFKLIKESNTQAPLAINIKSDGLHNLIQSAIDTYSLSNHFVFDAAVPDTLGYVNKNIPIFARVSEYEQTPHLLEKSIGIWLDSFDNDWFNKAVITSYLESGKHVCVVSPELHNRNYENVWSMLKTCTESSYSSSLYLCTDKPKEADEFINT